MDRIAHLTAVLERPDRARDLLIAVPDSILQAASPGELDVKEYALKAVEKAAKAFRDVGSAMQAIHRQIAALKRLEQQQS